MRRLAAAVTLAVGLIAASAPSASALSPAPASGRLRIVLERTYRDPTAIVSGDGVRVHGLIRPYVPGDHVIVSFRHGSSLVRRTSISVRPARDGLTGYFLLPLRLRTQGTITVGAIRRGSATEPTLTAASDSLFVAAGYLPHGSGGPSVWLMQRLLARRRYALNISGVVDETTVRAVVAFRKETDLGRNSAFDSRVIRALLDGRGHFPVRYPQHGKHVEADLAHQVLAEIDPGGVVRRIYQMSSGKPSTPTVVGNFAVYRKSFGVNAKGMVDSNYFISGYAIHGYPEVPLYAASHGCLRVPIPDALSIYNWIRIGDRVDVYTHGAGGSRRVNSNAGP